MICKEEEIGALKNMALGGQRRTVWFEFVTEDSKAKGTSI